LGVAADNVRSALGVDFRQRDGLFLGGTYDLAEPTRLTENGGSPRVRVRVRVRVRNNIDQLTVTPEEPGWSGPSIVMVEVATRPDDVIEHLERAGIEVLPREVGNPGDYLSQTDK
jgi:hypothetical protein